MCPQKRGPAVSDADSHHLCCSGRAAPGLQQVRVWGLGTGNWDVEAELAQLLLPRRIGPLEVHGPTLVCSLKGETGPGSRKKPRAGQQAPGVP